MARTLVVLIVWCVLGLPAGVAGVFWTLLRKNATQLYRWGVWVAAFGLRCGGVRVRYTMRQPLPEQTACLFLVNHASNLDPPLLASVLPRRVAMLLKQELLQIPLLGRSLRLAGFVPVARSGRVEDARHSLQQAAATLQSGLSLVAFVEGTRSPDGRLLPFKKGPFYLAENCQCPVVPVTIAGSHALLPKGAVWLRAGVIQITTHEILYPRDFAGRDALAAEVRRRIASALPVSDE